MISPDALNVVCVLSTVQNPAYIPTKRDVLKQIFSTVKVVVFVPGNVPQVLSPW
jgi:hypothetical protein